MIQKTVLGVFNDRLEAEEAISKLKDQDYNPKDLSIVMKDVNESAKLADSTGTSVASGAASGATTGAVIGGIAGLLIGIGAIAVPGIGAILIGGPLAAALGLTGTAATTISGATTGALAGGLLGALIGLGVPEDEARVYEERVKEGGILVAVPSRIGEEEDVKLILEESGADTIKTLSLNPNSKSDEDLTYEDEIDEPIEYVHTNSYDRDSSSQPVVRTSGYKGGYSKTSKPSLRKRTAKRA